MSDVQLAERYGVSRSTIWRWSQRGILPKPIEISPGTTRWRLDEIEKRDAERKSSAA
jgi:predicted DNA-binding transcriptional regulator AlpA